MHQQTRTDAIDDAVGSGGGDDLLAQPVTLDSRGISLAQRLREVALQLARQIGIGRAAGIGEGAIERDLAVSKQQREFRTRKSPTLAMALFQFLIGGQEFDRAIQFAMTFQPAQQLPMFVQMLCRATLHQAERFALQVVVAQYQRRHLIGRARQQAIAAAPAGWGFHRVRRAES